MSDAYSTFSTRTTPQSLPIPTQLDRQVANNAGGFVYTLDPWKVLERFLILGSEGGTFYVKAPELTRENALTILKLIETDGPRAVKTIVDVSEGGRALKNDPAIFALALCAAAKDPATRALALSQLSKVCRIPTHLFHFATYIQGLRGWGRGLRRAVGNWYQDQDVDRLAYAVVKYQSRDGWSNADLLRLSHPKTKDPARNALYRWIVDGFEGVKAKELSVPAIVEAFEEAKSLGQSDLHGLCKLITANNLPREALPTEALNNDAVWDALLHAGKGMPMTAMVRNLATMTRVGLLKPMSESARYVVDRLHDEGVIKAARLHPIALLIAQKTYASGHGLKGSNTWTPIPAIVDALNDAFYLSFSYLAPTGKRLLFGVDVSGSMDHACGGTGLTCAEGAAAMALACAKTEKEYYIMGFTAGPRGGRYFRDHDQQGSAMAGFVDLGITPSMRLEDALKRTRDRNFGSTDCALPMLWAQKERIGVDAFIVVTDSETWAGTVHPSQALKAYREQTGIKAAEVVIGMTASPFTIADPLDPLTLDVVGFDASVPQAIQEFLRG